MVLQHAARPAFAWIVCAAVLAGCASVRREGRRAASFRLVDAEADRSVRVYESDHFTLTTTLFDEARIGPIVSTLEAGFDAYVATTGVRPPVGSPRMSVFVFQRRAQWEAFTRRRLGRAAPLYLQLDRGGYTYETTCAVWDQGEADTLTVLAHEGLHLFVATHFKARPPPFVEEGLACLFETVRPTSAGGVRIATGENAGRAGRLRSSPGGPHHAMSLRTLATMHAGDVVGLTPAEVDAFYAQAWAFVRFLGEDAALRQSLMRLLRDAATAALSSDRLSDNPALLERYLGRSLDAIEPSFRAYVDGLAAPDDRD